MNVSREAERVRLDAFVKVLDSGGDELVFRTRDVSVQGLFLTTQVTRAYPFKVGTTMQLELHGPGQHVRCKVIVVRVVEPSAAEPAAHPTGFGVKILELSAIDRSTLLGMIEQVKQAMSA